MQILAGFWYTSAYVFVVIPHKLEIYMVNVVFIRLRQFPSYKLVL